MTGLADDLEPPDDGPAQPPATTTAPPDPASLRSSLEAANRRAAEAEQRAAAAEALVRTKDLAAAGLSTDAAAQYPAGADTTPEAVSAWLAKQQAAFGIQPTTAQPAGQTSAATAPPADQAAMQRAAQAAGQAIAPAEGIAGLQARMADKSIPYPQLLEELRAHGFNQLP